VQCGRNYQHFRETYCFHLQRPSFLLASYLSFYIFHTTRTNMGLNLSVHGKKPACNCMSYGTASLSSCYVSHISFFLSIHSKKVNLFAVEVTTKVRRKAKCGPPLWSSGQNSWLQIQRSRVRFLALPDFLRSSGSGTESTQPHEGN
jgi:hypothetical protein